MNRPESILAPFKYSKRILAKNQTSVKCATSILIYMLFPCAQQSSLQCQITLAQQYFLSLFEKRYLLLFFSLTI